MEIKKITISGLAGVGKGTTAQLLAERLGWEAMSGGDAFRAMAKEEGMTLGEFEEATKHDKRFDKKLDDWIAEYGRENEDFVFESRLAWYFIPDSFKVKLVCEDSERFRRIGDREEKSVGRVEEETRSREEAISERYEKYYGISDWSADENFDFLVDTTDNPPDEVVRMILDEKKRREG